MNDYLENAQELFNDVAEKIAAKGFASDGDMIVITGSTQRSSGSTNALQVHLVGDILLKGKGSGIENISGRACVIKDEDKDLGSFISGDILVVSRTTTDILHLMRQCSGIITEETDQDSGVVAAACALEIPVVSNAKSATSILKTGAKIKIDISKGYVYNSDTGDIN